MFFDLWIMYVKYKAIEDISKRTLIAKEYHLTNTAAGF